MVKPVSKSHAIKLRARAGVERLVLMTDSHRLPDPEAAIEQLPAGSIVILRDYEAPNRLALATSLRQVSRKAGCWFLVAGDAALARTVKADGIHLPEHMLRHKPLNLRGFSLVSAACHNRGALRRASILGVGLAIVSPVFPTESHPGASTLGIHRLSRLISGQGIAVAALGGISYRTVGPVRALKLAAIAGISGIVDEAGG